MPVVTSTYKNYPKWLFNGVLQTIVPNTRTIRLPYQRERLTLSDEDFVDLDWLVQGSNRLAIITHGLAGCSDDIYVVGAAAYLFEQGYDVLAWNCRSCSGDMNKQLRLYFHGEIGDIDEVIHHSLNKGDYESLYLIGFSMGGAITLKYLGVQGSQLPKAIKKGVAISTPCELEVTAVRIDAPINWYFRRRMFLPLKEKALHKAAAYPDRVSADNMQYVRSWRDFDEYFSAPINGYSSAKALYHAGSAIHFMGGIQIPTLLLNAKNDPILTPESFPEDFCRKHPYIILESPSIGGHVGFPSRNWKRTWSELRLLEFLEE